MVEVAVIFHMIGIAATVTEYCTGNPSFFFDIIIPTYFAYILAPASYTNKVSIIYPQQFLCFWQINSEIRICRDLNSEIRRYIFGHIFSVYFVSGILP